MLELLNYLNIKWQALDFEAAPLLTTSKLDKQLVQFAALEKIHKQLWDLESERRVLMQNNAAAGDSPIVKALRMICSEEYYVDIGRNAEKTTLLNDERQKIITEVNVAFGCHVVEKLYALEGDAQECAGCGKQTGWICPFCTPKKVWLCESTECRLKHEVKDCAHKQVTA